MEHPIELIERPEQAVLEISRRCSVFQMPMVISKSFKAIAEYMESKGQQVVLMPYVRYVNVCWDDLNKGKLTMFFKTFMKKWDMLVGVPLEEALPENRDIKAGTFDGGRYVQTLHVGPYQKVGDAYNRLSAYIKKENLKIKNESVEIYLNDPQIVAKDELQTRVLIPLDE